MDEPEQTERARGERESGSEKSGCNALWGNATQHASSTASTRSKIGQKRQVLVETMMMMKQ